MATTMQVTVKVSTKTVERADDLRDFIAENEQEGRPASRADVLRHAIALGLAQLEKRRSTTSSTTTPAAAAAK